MSPEEFIKTLNNWLDNPENTERDYFSDHILTTPEEAEAVCNAVAFCAGNKRAESDIFQLVSFFQTPENSRVIDVLRTKGLPEIRKIIDIRLDHISNPDKVYNADDNIMFALKILAMYGEQGDGDLIIRAAQTAPLSDEYLWSVIFDILPDNKHPDCLQICETLATKLPPDFLGIAFLDFANKLALNNSIDNHPFNSPEGLKRLSGFLTEPNPDDYSYAVSATAAIPFLKSEEKWNLLHHAEEHPDSTVKTEAAWALAKLNLEKGIEQLRFLCLNPRTYYNAAVYLEELGYKNKIPSRCYEPEFQAIAEMCVWLSHPHEFGCPPDEIELYDTSTMFWPPTDDTRTLYLFKYTYHDEDMPDDTGLGMVGSITFAHFGENTAELQPAEAYGLHCAWELEANGDPRTPGEITVQEGMKILAEYN